MQIPSNSVQKYRSPLTLLRCGSSYDSRNLTSSVFSLSKRVWRSCDRASWQISYNKPNQIHKFLKLIWKETLYVSGSSSVHHQEFFTVHTAMVYVIQVCWQLASCNGICHTGLLTARKLSANLYDIYHCCVYSEEFLMMDRGTVRNM